MLIFLIFLFIWTVGSDRSIFHQDILSPAVHTLRFTMPGKAAYSRRKSFLYPWQNLACMRARSLQSCPRLCNPLDCNPPGSSVHGILQARIREWAAMPSSRDRTPGLLHWQAGSLPLVPPGKPVDAVWYHPNPIQTATAIRAALSCVLSLGISAAGESCFTQGHLPSWGACIQLTGCYRG